MCEIKSWGGIKLYGDDGTNTALRSVSKSRCPSSAFNGMESLPVPDVLILLLPIPFIREELIFISVRILASLTMIHFVPVSIMKDLLSVSAIKQIFS